MMPEWMIAFEPLQAPAPTGWWPPAPGWWALAVLILAALGYSLIALYRRWRRRRYRRELERELARIWAHWAPDRNPAAIPAYLTDCCALLRRTWLLIEPAHASLPARDLLARLEDTPGITVPAPLKAHIEPLLYSQQGSTLDATALDLAAFHDQLLLWSRRHRGEASC